MVKEFVPYEMAVKLKELGFSEKCFRGYGSDGELTEYTIEFKNYNDVFFVNAPLWQQAFDWFRIHHNLCGVPQYLYHKEYCYSVEILDFQPKNELGFITPRQMFSLDFETYEESRLACLEKLIELCKKKQSK